MRAKSLSLLVMTAAIFSTGVEARMIVTEDWRAQVGAQACQIGLERYSDALQGNVITIGNCPHQLRSVKNFTFTDEQRTDLILFSGPGLQNPIGTLEAHGNWSYLVGQLEGSGISLQYLSYRETASQQRPPAPSAQTPRQDPNCKRYVGTGTCAVAQDQTIPEIPTFQTISMRAQADQALYSFKGGNGFPLEVRAQNGQCLTAKRCEWDRYSEASWCEIVLPDGFRTGYLKQLDNHQVYLSHGC